MLNSALADCILLVIEDEVLIALDLQRVLEDANAEVHLATSAEQAMLLAINGQFSAVVADYQLPDGKSDTLLEILTARRIPFVRYSGFDVPSLGGVFLSKPATSETIVRAVETALSQAF